MPLHYGSLTSKGQATSTIGTLYALLAIQVVPAVPLVFFGLQQVFFLPFALHLFYAVCSFLSSQPYIMLQEYSQNGLSSDWV